MDKSIIHANYKDIWQTPKWLFDWCDKKYGPFTFDCCATSDNALCPEFSSDFLKVDHKSGNLWMNPPYGKPLPDLLYHGIRMTKRGSFLTALLPANMDARWVHDLVLNEACLITFLRGRVQFELPEDIKREMKAVRQTKWEAKGKTGEAPATGNQGGSMIVHYSLFYKRQKVMGVSTQEIKNGTL